jgi:hypothetical protein
MGMALNREQAESLLMRVRLHAVENKPPPAPGDVRRFYLEINKDAQEWTRQ